MNHTERQPSIGDEVIVVRCDDNPAMVGETAEVVGVPPLFSSHENPKMRVRIGDVEVELGAGDFVLRRK